MSSLPPLATLNTGDTDTLTAALSLLFEPSPALTHLAPQVAARLAASPAHTYADIINAALGALASWPPERKAHFVGGHPRIGESAALSALSAREQAARATPPAVLARLAHLNACYEHRYPGLIYITFVNGRSRAEVMCEMEDVLGLERSLDPVQPELGAIGVVEVGGPEWMGELERAVADVGRIAKSRLGTLGVQ